MAEPQDNKNEEGGQINPDASSAFAQMFGGQLDVLLPPPDQQQFLTQDNGTVFSVGHSPNYNAIKMPVVCPIVPPGGFDVNKMSEFLIRNSSAHSHDACALNFREGLSAGGLKTFDTDHPEFAGQYDPYMRANGFKEIGAGHGGRFDGTSCTQFDVGDCIVIRKPGEPGHVAALCSDGVWHSDFTQDGASKMFGGPSLMANDATFTVYRHSSLMKTADASPVANIDVATNNHANSNAGTFIPSKAAAAPPVL